MRIRGLLTNMCYTKRRTLFYLPEWTYVTSWHNNFSMNSQKTIHSVQKCFERKFVGMTLHLSVALQYFTATIVDVHQ